MAAVTTKVSSAARRLTVALIYGLVVLGPVIVLAIDLLLGKGSPLTEWPDLMIPHGRRLILWLRSIGLASAVSAGSLALGGLVALRLRRRRHGIGWAWLFAMLAALPPMTHALAWSWLLARINIALRQSGLQTIPTSGWALAGWVQAIWLAPLATGLALLAFRSVPTDLIESACLLRPGTSPLFKVVLPLAGPLLLAGGGLLFLLSLVDYGIPSIYQVNVLALEVFADFSVHGDPPRALLVTAPLLAVTATMVIGSQARLRVAAIRPPQHRRVPAYTETWPRWLTAGGNGATAVMVLAMGVPVVSLVAQVDSFRTLAAALSAGSGEIAYSFSVALAAALLSLPLATAVAQRIVQGDRLSHGWWLAVTLPMALPGPLTGIGLIRLWNQPVLAPAAIYGSRWMPVLAALARYTPLATLVMAATLQRADPALADAARLLQASRWRRQLLVNLPMLAPGLIAAGCVVFCLTLGELSATLLVAAPGHPTLTMRIYNYLHYGASGTVAGLTLAMTALVVALGAITVLVQALWARMTDLGTLSEETVG